MAPPVAASLRDRKKLQTWRTIRAAALALIDEHGFEAVSVEQIAATAGVARTTFFNYFVSKEAVVFDPDPEDAIRWRALIEARSVEEPPWEFLTAVFFGFADLVGDRLALQKVLKSRSPTLAESARDSSDSFLADVRTWLGQHHSDPGDQVETTFLFHLAVAAASTAYETWDPHRPFQEYLDTLRWCFEKGARVIG
ncbi:TetR/AcrR family transcriptional regulator [Nocardia jejuensis]|uniref:TetR/AcrR family transcriptional regulator n=1 Tax=Nocardia jejuensis TaxID=328049 RepID=UPI0008344871|nr:TetR/AcrR family transcriptional regulator [Nocardia jejuensis]